jgi:hypothetical protein
VEEAAARPSAPWLTGDAVLVGLFSQSSAIPLATSPPSGVARRATGTALGRSPESVHGARIPPATKSKPVVGQFAPPRLQLAIGASAVMLALLALALRRTWQPGTPLEASGCELDPPCTPLDLDDVSGTDGLPSNGLRHHLGAIDSWARTLDDRWPTLTEADKRIAVQIILRNASAAIDELREPLVTA